MHSGVLGTTPPFFDTYSGSDIRFFVYNAADVTNGVANPGATSLGGTEYYWTAPRGVDAAGTATAPMVDLFNIADLL